MGSCTTGRGGLVFFFQAEDGIRHLTVTGVQTCALPISRRARRAAASVISAVTNGFPSRSPPTQLPRVSGVTGADRKSTRLNSTHSQISYAVFCLKKKKKQ